VQIEYPAQADANFGSADFQASADTLPTVFGASTTTRPRLSVTINLPFVVPAARFQPDNGDRVPIQAGDKVEDLPLGLTASPTDGVNLAFVLDRIDTEYIYIQRFPISRGTGAAA
jgi:hypothetical protein